MPGDETRFQRGIEGQGRLQTAFDAAQVTECLDSPLFHIYVVLASVLENIPQRLAQQMESCVCHQKLFQSQGMVKNEQREMLQTQYGKGIFVCPLAGKNFPELVLGEAEQMMESVWAVAETELYLAPLPVSRALTSQEWQSVLHDFHCAREKTILFWRTKTSYLQTLPWLLGGLSHLNETTARSCCSYSQGTVGAGPQARGSSSYHMCLPQPWASQRGS